MMSIDKENLGTQSVVSTKPVCFEIYIGEQQMLVPTHAKVFGKASSLKRYDDKQDERLKQIHTFVTTKAAEYNGTLTPAFWINPNNSKPAADILRMRPEEVIQIMALLEDIAHGVNSGGYGVEGSGFVKEADQNAYKPKIAPGEHCDFNTSVVLLVQELTGRLMKMLSELETPIIYGLGKGKTLSGISESIVRSFELVNDSREKRLAEDPDASSTDMEHCVTHLCTVLGKVVQLYVEEHETSTLAHGDRTRICTCTRSDNL